MSSGLEINVTLQTVSVRADARAQLYFTVTSTSRSKMSLDLAVEAGPGLDGASDAIDGGRVLHLSARQTAQIRALLILPAGTRSGRYTARLVASVEGTPTVRSSIVEVLALADIPHAIAAPTKRPDVGERFATGSARWFAWFSLPFGLSWVDWLGLFMGTLRDGRVVNGRAVFYVLIALAIAGAAMVLRTTGLPTAAAAKLDKCDAVITAQDAQKQPAKDCLAKFATEKTVDPEPPQPTVPQCPCQLFGGEPRKAK